MAKSVNISQILVRTISPGILISLRSTVTEGQISVKHHQDRVVPSENLLKEAKSLNISQIPVRTILPGMLTLSKPSQWDQVVREYRRVIRSDNSEVILATELNTKFNGQLSDYSGLDIDSVNFYTTM